MLHVKACVEMRAYAWGRKKPAICMYLRTCSHTLTFETNPKPATIRRLNRGSPREVAVSGENAWAADLYRVYLPSR